MEKEILVEQLEDGFQLLVTPDGLGAGYFENDSFTNVFIEESFCIHTENFWNRQKQASDGMPLFDYWSQDFEEKFYFEGIHKEFIEFIEENGWYLDWIYSGIIACYKQ